jgi:hypothetical protein
MRVSRGTAVGLGTASMACGLVVTVSWNLAKGLVTCRTGFPSFRTRYSKSRA